MASTNRALDEEETPEQAAAREASVAQQNADAQAKANAQAAADKAKAEGRNPAIANLLKQLGGDNEATRAISAALYDKYGLGSLSDLGRGEAITVADEYTDPGDSGSSLQRAGYTYNPFINKNTGQQIGDLGFLDKEGKGTTHFALDPTTGKLTSWFTPRSHGIWDTGLMDFANMVPGLNAYTVPLTAARLANQGEWGKALALMVPQGMNYLANSTDIMSNLAGAQGADFNPVAKTPVGMMFEAGTGIQGNVADTIGKAIQSGAISGLSGADVGQGVINSLTSDSLGGSLGKATLGDTGITLGTAGNVASLAANLASGNPNLGAALSSTGSLLDNSTLSDAGKAFSLGQGLLSTKVNTPQGAANAFRGLASLTGGGGGNNAPAPTGNNLTSAAAPALSLDQFTTPLTASAAPAALTALNTSGTNMFDDEEDNGQSWGWDDTLVSPDLSSYLNTVDLSQFTDGLSGIGDGSGLEARDIIFDPLGAQGEEEAWIGNSADFGEPAIVTTRPLDSATSIDLETTSGPPLDRGFIDDPDMRVNPDEPLTYLSPRYSGSATVTTQPVQSARIETVANPFGGLAYGDRTGRATDSDNWDLQGTGPTSNSEPTDELLAPPPSEFTDEPLARPVGVGPLATWNSEKNRWEESDDEGNTVTYDRSGNPIVGGVSGPGYTANGQPIQGERQILKGGTPTKPTETGGAKTAAGTGTGTGTGNKLVDAAKKLLTGTGAAGAGQSGLGSLLPLLLMMFAANKSGSSNAPAASSAGIPALTATQMQTPYSAQMQAPGYRPGQGGISYFNPVQYAPRMAAGGIANLRAPKGRLLDGAGDGVSDSIPATIGKTQPARLARGEFVVDARSVAELGNGSTQAGSEKLEKMLERLHQARKKVGRGQDSHPDRYLPA